MKNLKTLIRLVGFSTFKINEEKNSRKWDINIFGANKIPYKSHVTYHTCKLSNFIGYALIHFDPCCCRTKVLNKWKIIQHENIDAEQR